MPLVFKAALSEAGAHALARQVVRDGARGIHPYTTAEPDWEYGQGRGRKPIKVWKVQAINRRQPLKEKHLRFTTKEEYEAFVHSRPKSKLVFRANRR